MNGKVLRLLDANANRAREALRVLEDYARFVLDDDQLSAELKNLRHEFAGATSAWAQDALLHRDVEGDVGTTIKTAAELHRQNLNDVVIAAGKRLGEALRALEEYSKIISPADSIKLEKLRYRFYRIEYDIGLSLRPADLFRNLSLYVLITEQACKREWFETAQAAIAGGAGALQLREKELESGELLRRAIRLVNLCRKNKVICIINDRPDIALLSDADGVHVGQGDLPVAQVRKIIGSQKIVGVSTHEISQAKQAIVDGADYIGVGPVFRSSTKPRDWETIPGLDYARQVAATIKLPAVAIAGITLENIGQVTETGITAVAVTAAVTQAENVEEAARSLKDQLLQ